MDEGLGQRPPAPGWPEVVALVLASVAIAVLVALALLQWLEQAA